MKDLIKQLKIYFSSYGIAWFDLDTFIKILKYLFLKRSISNEELNRVLIRLSKNKLATTGREGYYFNKLLWHLGIVITNKEHRKKYYTLSTYGRKVVTSLFSAKTKEEKVEIIRNVFKRWYPLVVFLEYIGRHNSVRKKDIVENLGMTMRKWTSILHNLGITKKGNISKPYNNFVVSALFLPLSLQLGLIEKESSRYHLTKEGKEFLKYTELEKDIDVIRTMPGDYTIYSAIADVLYDAKEPIIVSPWVNGTLKTLIKNVARVNSNLKELTVIIRNTQRNQENLKTLIKSVSIPVNVFEYKNLHAKVTINYEGPAIESSANLLATSLKRNYEVGTYYRKTPLELALAVEELVSISHKIVVEV